MLCLFENKKIRLNPIFAGAADHNMSSKDQKGQLNKTFKGLKAQKNVEVIFFDAYLGSPKFYLEEGDEI